MMFTCWPRPSAPFPSAPFSQLSLPDLFDFGISLRQCQCRPSAAALLAPHSFPQGIDSAFCHCPRQSEPIRNTRSASTQTDGDSFSGLFLYSKEGLTKMCRQKDPLDEFDLANLCAQLANCLLDISDGWTNELELKRNGGEKLSEEEGMFGRIFSFLFNKLW